MFFATKKLDEKGFSTQFLRRKGSNDRIQWNNRFLNQTIIYIDICIDDTFSLKEVLFLAINKEIFIILYPWVVS